MNQLLIDQQAEAEQDQYLFQCFHDSGQLEELLSSTYTILAGRKGAGKTAIAQYLVREFDSYQIDIACRFSIRNFNADKSGNRKDKLNDVLSFIVIKTVQKLLEVNYFDAKATGYWNNFLSQSGLQHISSYDEFKVSKESTKKSFSGKLGIPKFFGGIGTQSDAVTQKERVEISESPLSLYERLKESIPADKKIILFIDDISDYLSDSDPGDLREDLDVIQDLLLYLQTVNYELKEQGAQARFVALMRDDLFDFMGGSNVNKLRRDSLYIRWGENDLAQLLIRRLPSLVGNLEDHLRNPIKSLKTVFPDSIFGERVKESSLQQYQSYFYCYMVAISFNRPRDFLQFCHVLRKKLGTRRPVVEFKNIQAAEQEYSDYFLNEVKDELFIVSGILEYDLEQTRIGELVDLLNKENGFGFQQLRTDLGRFFNIKTGGKTGKTGNASIEKFILELWRYGIIGFSEKKNEVIHFKYLSDSSSLFRTKTKEYKYHLHRGLWWFARKNKGELS